MAYDSQAENGTFGSIGVYGGGLPSQLMQIMEQDAIEPGKSPSYEACKIIYAYHPLGARMVDAPLEMAMSQERNIEIPGAPEERLINEFKKEYHKLGAIGADNIIYRVAQLSRIYGIATLGVNIVGKDGKTYPTNEALPLDELYTADLYFNIFDPLNTAGSLVMNQDPTAADFLHPRNVRVGNQNWSNTKALVLMHEQPMWIQWTDSAFGFVGRSVYQRAFFPLKSFINSMIADDLVQDKLALLVYKGKSPGTIIDNVMQAFANFRRQKIKGAKTGNVLQIGPDEELASLDLQHIDSAGRYSRENILKNIATAAGQPAIFLNQDTLAEGFGEGSEDAKQVARYIDRVRIEMQPAYDFIDPIVQRRAWNPEFYKKIQKDFPEQYGSLSYEAAFQSWKDAWRATWPNLLTEPDSEKAKAVESRLKMAIEACKIMVENGTQRTKADALEWLADVINDEKEFYSSPITIDAEDIAEFEPTSLIPEGFGDEED